MKIFLDTANVTEMREGVAMGLVDGCTTNPSLIAKEKRPFARWSRRSAPSCRAT